MNRRFIAVVPEGLDENQDLKRLLSKLKRTVKEREMTVRWVHPSLWHVTLAFLGTGSGDLDVVARKIKSWQAKAQAQAQVDESKPLHLRLTGLGAFPHPEQARVLWLGVQASQGFLDIQEELSGELRQAGFQLETRAFQPHLTLARFRNLSSLSNLVGLGGRKHFGDYPIRELVLFESNLENNIIKYSIQKRWQI